MQGIVKWYSADKRFGFVLGEDAVERYFNARDISSSDVPASGDVVTFRHQPGKKGPYAVHVQIVWRARPERADEVPDRDPGKPGLFGRIARAVFG